MSQKEMSRWLKLLLVLAMFIALFLAFVLAPSVAEDQLATRVHYLPYKLPFEIYIWISAMPFFYTLVIAWGIFTRMGNDNSFCEENAKALKAISRLSVFEALYYFVGEILLLATGILFPPLIITFAIVIFFSFAVAVFSAAISYLVRKGWELKTENDLTV
jgi:hypothetical protein